MKRKITKRIENLCLQTQIVIEKGNKFAKTIINNSNGNFNTQNMAQEWQRIQEEYDNAELKIDATLETLEDLKDIWDKECHNAVDFLHKFDEVYIDLVAKKGMNAHKKTIVKKR